MPRCWRVPERSVEHRSIAFGGPQGLAKLSSGRQAGPTWDTLHRDLQDSANRLLARAAYYFGAETGALNEPRRQESGAFRRLSGVLQVPLQLVQARPGPQGHDRSLAAAAQYRHSALVLGLLLVLPVLAAEKDPCAAASTAQDVRFELSLKDHGAIFQAGEIVPLSLSFSSTAAGRYTAMIATYDRSGRLNEEHYCVEPESPDPLGVYYRTHPTMGGGARGMQQLSEAPLVADAELNEWRNLPPGHYRLYATSHRVLRPPDPQEVLCTPPRSHAAQG